MYVLVSFFLRVLDFPDLLAAHERTPPHPL